MTIFFADLRVYRNPDHHYWTPSVSLDAPDLVGAVIILKAWGSGLRATGVIDTVIIEGVSSNKSRGSIYQSLDEAAAALVDFLSGR